MRRLLAGLIAAALTALWAILIVRLKPHAQAICAAMPDLAVTLELAFAGFAFLIAIRSLILSSRSLAHSANAGLPLRRALKPSC